MSTPVTALGASDPGDQLRITYHPSFASGAKETATRLRAQLRRHEEICQEICVVIGMSPEAAEDMDYNTLPVLVGAALAQRASRGA